MTTLATDPEHIAVSKSRGIDIDWKDGHHSSYTVEYLRDWCPCATCTGAHGTEPRKKSTEEPKELFPMFKPRIRMNSIEQSGNYALHISWNDGHSSGIYSWDHLRRICPCEICKPPAGASPK
ncbi:MAG TPA: DUF971 domain-containing protein [Bryobacteraceae bacterium]|nr:DUF971 domain-containing protein [Bryobacteraceae bacterium]